VWSKTIGRWIQLSKRHPDITSDNEVVNVQELGPAEGGQIVHGQHFYTTVESGEAQELAVFIKTESALQANDAERLFCENLRTRLNDGYVRARYLNFRLGKFVYVGEWNPKLQKFT
jgi:hypothetical protein